MGAPPPALDIRPLGAFDLALAAAVHAACFEESWSTKAIADILAMPGSLGLVALAEDEPVGLVLALATAPDAELLSLGVVGPWRRRGIACRLFDATASRLAAEGVRRLHLEVAEDNLAARDLYRALGFAEHGRRPGYYCRAGGRVAALLLDRALSAPAGGKDRNET